MISPEHQERYVFKSFFPIEKESVQKAMNWQFEKMQDFDDRNSEMLQLQAEHFDISSFIYGMGFFRGHIQWGNDNRLIAAYENGALFMFNAINQQLQLLGANIEVKKNTMISYFLDLMEIEFNRRKLETIDANNSLINEADQTLYPLTAALISTQNSPDGQVLVKSFVDNSTKIAHKMLIQEQVATEALTNGTFVRTYGPLEGLKFGASDIYHLFKFQEDKERHEKIWNIPFE